MAQASSRGLQSLHPWETAGAGLNEVNIAKRVLADMQPVSVCVSYGIE